LSKPFNHALPPYLADYDLAPPLEIGAPEQQGVNNASLIVRTGRGDYIARAYLSKSYDDPASIGYEHRLLNRLADARLSFAVPVPIPTRGGALLCRGTSGWVSLSRYLPGARLDPRASDQVELLGASLGELHAALRHYPDAPRPGRPLFGELFRFPLLLRDPFTVTPQQLGLPDAPPYDELLRWWREEAARLRVFLDGPYRDLPRQLCHNDITPANVLVDAGRVTGVLDFEFAALAACALDVAMGLRMTMRVWDDPEPWDIVRHFCRGYTQWVQLTEQEVQTLPWLIRLRGAIAVLWWLGHVMAVGESGPIPERITYLRNFVHWLEDHEQRFVDVMLRAIA